MKIKENTAFMIKSPKLKSVIVESILVLLYIKDLSISELLLELQRRLHYSPSSAPYKLLKKYLVHLTDYELITYNGQRQVFSIEDNGLDLLNWFIIEKRKLMANSKDITITIERKLI